MGSILDHDVCRTAIAVPSLPFEGIEVMRRLDGRHVRLSNGRRHRAVGRYASTKMGATVPWESRVELHDLYRAEVDPNVISYSVQPETLNWRANGKSFRYTPDRLERMVGRRMRMIEVKDDFNADADPEYSEKLSQAAQIYSALGISFEIRTSAAIRMEPSFSAAEEVQAYKRTVVTSADLEVVQDRLGANPVAFFDLLQSVPSSHPRATLYAMMVRRIVNIDISRGLIDTAPVSLVRRVN